MKARIVYLTLALVLVFSLAAVAIVPAMPVAAQQYTLILGLDIPDTARVVDYDDGSYVVGTSGGSLYVINEAGEYTVTALGAGSINDVRIESPFIAVAANTTVIELQLSLPDLTPTELWRTTLSDWGEVVSTDLSEDGDYVCYLARTNLDVYTNAGEIGMLTGTDGSLISRLYASGYYLCNWWLDATGDMEYIAASQPMGGCCYNVGVALYRFDGSALTLAWWRHLIAEYDVTEVRVSEAKDWVAAATSSGTEMCLLDLATGNESPRYNTPGKEQFAVDGDDNLNYVIGANQAWSPPYAWFILENLGASGYSVVGEGNMTASVNDLDSTSDGSYFAFGSDAGEFILLETSGNIVFTGDVGRLIDSIEIGNPTLLVGGDLFINLYGSPLLPTIAYSPSSFSFSATKGGANPLSQTLSIWNSGGGTLDWSVGDDATWLSLSPTSGNSTGETDSVTVSVDISGLSAGSYSATITITAPGATNTPQTVPVSLEVVGPCFIATAAYGTSTAAEIDTLRAFRDEVLLQNSLGSQLVALYYEVSPPVADFISEHEGLRTLVRELLVDPVVWVVDAIGTLWRD